MPIMKQSIYKLSIPLFHSNITPDSNSFSFYSKILHEILIPSLLVIFKTSTMASQGFGTGLTLSYGTHDLVVSQTSCFIPTSCSILLSFIPYFPSFTSPFISVRSTFSPPPSSPPVPLSSYTILSSRFETLTLT